MDISCSQTTGNQGPHGDPSKSITSESWVTSVSALCVRAFQQSSPFKYRIFHQLSTYLTASLQLIYYIYPFIHYSYKSYACPSKLS